jgi:hypothetical protein
LVPMLARFVRTPLLLGVALGCLVLGLPEVQSMSAPSSPSLLLLYCIVPHVWWVLTRRLRVGYVWRMVEAWRAFGRFFTNTFTKLHVEKTR